MYIIISPIIRNSLTSSFPICIPLISFSCLITLASPLRTILTRNGNSGHPCFITYFTEIISNYCPYKMMLAVGIL